MLTDGRTGDALVKSHECPDCRETSTLVNRWNREADSYEVVCGRCKGDRLQRKLSLTEQWKRNPASVNIAVANRLQDKYGGEEPMSTAIAKWDERTVLERINRARFPNKLEPHEKQMLAQAAVEYGLDPFMQELTIYEGQLYVKTIGYERLASRHPLFEGLEDRPMTDTERKAYGVTAPLAWIAKVYKRGMRVPAVGTGTANAGRPHRNNPVEKEHPEWLARSRAVRQALRVYFPACLPFQSAEERGIMVDVHTGEIVAADASDENVIESTATEIATKAPAESFPDPEEPEPEAAEAPTTNGERAALEAQLRQLSDAQGRTWAKVVEHFTSKTWNHEWADATVAELKAAISTVQASGKKAS